MNLTAHCRGEIHYAGILDCLTLDEVVKVFHIVTPANAGVQNTA